MVLVFQIADYILESELPETCGGGGGGCGPLYSAPRVAQGLNACRRAGLTGHCSLYGL